LALEMVCHNVRELQNRIGDGRLCSPNRLARAHGGRITAAAAALGISRKTLWEKMRRHGIRVGMRDEAADRLN